LKRKETFNTSAPARSRASALRVNEHVSHVTMDKENDRYIVRYSVAKWYMQSLASAGVTL
ncbi:MAG: hypothetical protein AAF570_22505, partial [Bacteroidota bacterium]